jgi:pilus assembly protein CpaD
MNLKSCITLSLAALTLTGCTSDYFTPTHQSDRKIEVSESQYETSYNLSTLNAAQLEMIAADFRRYGGDILSITVSYDQKAQTSQYTASQAMQKAGEIATTLRNDLYIKHVDASILPASGTAPKLFVAYKRFEAHAPAGCGVAPGIDGLGTDTEDRIKDYELGCSLNTLIAKQTYRPKDLLGKDYEVNDSEAKRRVNSLYSTGYYDGAPNEALNGETASDE